MIVSAARFSLEEVRKDDAEKHDKKSAKRIGASCSTRTMMFRDRSPLQRPKLALPQSILFAQVHRASMDTNKPLLAGWLVAGGGHGRFGIIS